MSRSSARTWPLELGHELARRLGADPVAQVLAVAASHHVALEREGELDAALKRTPLALLGAQRGHPQPEARRGPPRRRRPAGRGAPAGSPAAPRRRGGASSPSRSARAPSPRRRRRRLAEHVEELLQVPLLALGEHPGLPARGAVAPRARTASSATRRARRQPTVPSATPPALNRRNAVTSRRKRARRLAVGLVGRRAPRRARGRRPTPSGSSGASSRAAPDEREAVTEIRRDRRPCRSRAGRRPRCAGTRVAVKRLLDLGVDALEALLGEAEAGGVLVQALEHRLERRLRLFAPKAVDAQPGRGAGAEGVGRRRTRGELAQLPASGRR